MIKTIVKSHPLRDIILDFDDAITPPQFEQEALAHYYKAHDLTYAVRLEAAARMPRLRAVYAVLSDLLLRSLAIEQDLDFLEDALGIAKSPDLDSFEGELTIRLEDFYSMTLKHSEDLHGVYDVICALTDQYNADIQKIDEDEYLIDPMYFGVLHELYGRYDEVSVHTVSLDDDNQNFLGAYGDVEKEYFAYTDFANLVFEKYGQLVPASDKLYRRVELVEAKLKEKLDENPGESL
ncbi:hypothetical protein [Sphingobacterium bambusae]|uniref:Uncharacterized protein n=1 Tax=Sphingobacterium bambusae TaxID=662858 RepID=A0ABW6BP50_9SPHI|nr:hypothetical protein [Sphingobacterium bambusae]WPL46706.1 hypothetical protein SCB77_12075 [Sphingobacterium bambusae]